MSLWLIRAGRAGERESLALGRNVVGADWDGLPDLSQTTSRTRLEALLRETFPLEKARTLNNWHGQIWALRETIQVGDLVVLPLKSRAAIALGTVAGPYQYRLDLPCGPLHTRPVEWRAEVPRRAFDLDILLSFGAFMTICRVERNGAEERVRALLERPGPAEPVPAPPPAPDIEARALDQIRERIAQRFKGHELARLIAALLEVQGYRARVSQPGPDGGVDVLAGSGPLGMGSPRLVVQVKSQDTRLDIHPLRELSGSMNRFQAEQGMLVGWGGFSAAVRAEAAHDYFRIRLWEADDVVAAVKEHYAALPAAIRAEIPLRQVWTLDPGAHAA